MIPLPGTAYLLAAAFVAGAFSTYKVMDWKADAEHTQVIEASLSALDQAHKTARAAEQDHANAANAIAIRLNVEKSHAKAENDRLTALLNDGTLRLRDPGAGNPAGDRSCPGDTTATPRGDNGAQAGDLSAETGRFLLTLAWEADQVAHQLAACQTLIVEDRKR